MDKDVKDRYSRALFDKPYDELNADERREFKAITEGTDDSSSS